LLLLFSLLGSGTAPTPPPPAVRLGGVHLLPATGEFTYDPVAYLGQRTTESAAVAINTYAGASPKTDFDVAIDQLVAQHPECTTVSLVCSWFFNATDASACNVYPSTTYIGGAFRQAGGGSDVWRCSSLTQSSSGLIPIPSNADGRFIYGGTPSDQSLVRCVRDLRARGFKIVFYPFLLGTGTGEPWRGRITYSPDVSSAATAAVNTFLGSASASQFTRDLTRLTVAYSGSPTDWTYRRMILHYANLMVVAGGVDLFVIGSELRGLETIRGPAWTKAGTTNGAGHAVWDYPFVAGLVQLASDVRGVLDGAGLTKNVAGLTNLITYSADWSSWMGWQHPGANGQWPHLDSLYSSTNIDFVSFDNYLPLSDWTTGNGGLDADNWQAPAPTSWPVASPNGRGFGLSGAPTLYSTAYFNANIEGGEKFDWFYADGDNGGAGDDPLGSGLIVSLPAGDRATQTRQRYYSGQEILANKQVRWWWNNTHRAVYDTGSGFVQQGPTTEWVANSKPVIFLEYGFPACDRATNQPNVFFTPTSTESATPYWSAWQSVSGGGIAPVRDDTILALALDAIYDYWRAHNASVGGVPMIQETFCCAWNWDARPFPTFPLRGDVWGDAGAWAAGNWIGIGRTTLPPVAPSPDPTPPSFPAFPSVATLGWSVHVKPKFSTFVASHASGRETRAPYRANALYDIELTYDVLRADANAELQTIAGFYLSVGGQNALFTFTPPNADALLDAPLLCRFAEDVADLENFMSLLWNWGSVKLSNVRF
jgi:hypothetical protein